MDHLSKQQIVLLTLLVSFVTALATGISTVSLMNQMPQGVTQTISRVIERTIQAAAPGAPQDAAVGVVSISVNDQAAEAVKRVSNLIVKMKDSKTGNISGLGLIVSKNGVVLTDKSTIAGLYAYSAIFPSGVEIPMYVVQSQTNGDLVFLAPNAPLNAPIDISALSATSSPVLGQSVFSLTGTSTMILGQGMIDSISNNIDASIPPSKLNSFAPLFTADGNVIGIRPSMISSASNSSNVSGASNSGDAQFYLMNDILKVTPGR